MMVVAGESLRRVIRVEAVTFSKQLAGHLVKILEEAVSSGIAAGMLAA